MSLNTWHHIALVKYASDARNIYVYLNGTYCGPIPCGTNASTTSQWAWVTIGNIIGYTGFHFRGRIGGLKVSNVPLYANTQSFQAPFTLTKSSPQLLTTNNSVLLLGPSFKEIIGNVTLTGTATGGTIETYKKKSGSITKQNCDAF